MNGALKHFGSAFWAFGTTLCVAVLTGLVALWGHWPGVLALGTALGVALAGSALLALRWWRSARRLDLAAEALTRSAQRIGQGEYARPVEERGHEALGELAEAEHVPSSAATRIADKLEAAGYAIRKPNPRDRRGVNLAITPAGRRMVDERRKQGSAWLAGRLTRLDDGQRRALADALDVLDTVLLFDDDAQAGAGTSDAADELAGKESR